MLAAVFSGASAMILEIDETPFYGGSIDKLTYTRELALVLLEQLYISFDRMGQLSEAGPMLDRLTAIAYMAGRNLV
jgi:hypothetical protein